MAATAAGSSPPASSSTRTSLPRSSSARPGRARTQRRLDVGAEARAECAQDRRVDLVAAHADAGTHHSAKLRRRGADADQGPQGFLHHASRETSPAGVDRRNAAASRLRHEHRHAVGGDDPDVEPRHLTHDSVRLLAGARRACAGRHDPRAVHLSRSHAVGRLGSAAHAEAMDDAAIGQQRMDDRPRFAHLAASRRANVSRAAARSGGSGASKRRRSPVRGCVNASTAACSAGRSRARPDSRARP